MPQCQETCVVALPLIQAFDLVADVERYPSFLPLWREARIVAREGSSYETVQTVGFGWLIQRFRTRTELDRPRTIRIKSLDEPFHAFEIVWQFAPSGDGGCLVTFDLTCEVRSFLLRPYLEMLVVPTAKAMVSAFERQAEALKGLDRRAA